MNARAWRRRFAGALAIGLVGAIAVAGVSLALWNERVPISDAQLHSGTVELTVNGEASAVVNVPITANLTTPRTVYTAITVSNNAGNRGVYYRLSGSTGDSPVAGLESSLTMSIGVPTSAAQCVAGTPGPTIRVSGPLDGATFTPRPLAAAAGEVLCLGITAPAVSNAVFREGAATVTLNFYSENQ